MANAEALLEKFKKAISGFDDNLISRIEGQFVLPKEREESTAIDAACVAWDAYLKSTGGAYVPHNGSPAYHRA